MKDYKTIKTLNDIKNIEIVTGVSEKYVPIYTSELVKTLEPEFKLESGYAFGYGNKGNTGSSKHYVDLVSTKPYRLPFLLQGQLFR